jgi:thioredoxin-like negative regulator of GroEL
VSPNSASRQGALGDAALRCGHTDVAEAAYRRSIRLGEHSTLKSPTPYLGLARVYSTLDRPKEALQVLGELGQRFDTADVQIRAKAEEVRVLHRSGDTEGATALARTLSERMQGDGPDLGAAATLELAETFMLTGQRDEASQLLQFVMRNNDDNNEIATQARAVFDQGGMGEEGQALLDQSRQQAREAMQEGVRQLSEGKLGDALDQMRAARAAMPHNPRALLNLAYVLIVTLEKQGWRHDFDDEARKSVLAAQHLAPGEPRATQLLVRLEKAGSSRLAAPRA